jgi:hypothetical protein
MPLSTFRPTPWLDAPSFPDLTLPPEVAEITFTDGVSIAAAYNRFGYPASLEAIAEGRGDLRATLDAWWESLSDDERPLVRRAFQSSLWLVYGYLCDMEDYPDCAAWLYEEVLNWRDRLQTLGMLLARYGSDEDREFVQDQFARADEGMMAKVKEHPHLAYIGIEGDYGAFLRSPDPDGEGNLYWWS